MEDQTAGGRGWAVPGSAAEQPARRDAGDGSGPAPRAPGAAPAAAGDAPAGSVPHVALRPMTLADILDGGFGIVKARPRRILGVAAGFVVPMELLSSFSQRHLFGGLGLVDVFSADPATTADSSSADLAPILAAIVAAFLAVIALSCVTAAVAHLVGQWIMGRDAPAREVVGVVGRRFGALLVAVVTVKLAEGAGAFACYIGILFVMTLFVVVTPAIIIEGVGPFAAMGRSTRLIGPRYFPVMGTAVLIGIIGSVLTAALSALPQGVAYVVGFDRAWLLLALGGIAANVVVLPFTAAATVLLYLDLRVRSEGLDVEMAAIDLFDRAG